LPFFFNNYYRTKFRNPASSRFHLRSWHGRHYGVIEGRSKVKRSKGSFFYWHDVHAKFR